jgi:hypothetical protein
MATPGNLRLVGLIPIDFHRIFTRPGIAARSSALAGHRLTCLHPPPGDSEPAMAA